MSTAHPCCPPRLTWLSACMASGWASAVRFGPKSSSSPATSSSTTTITPGKGITTTTLTPSASTPPSPSTPRAATAGACTPPGSWEERSSCSKVGLLPHPHLTAQRAGDMEQVCDLFCWGRTWGRRPLFCYRWWERELGASSAPVSSFTAVSVALCAQNRASQGGWLSLQAAVPGSPRHCEQCQMWPRTRWLGMKSQVCMVPFLCAAHGGFCDNITLAAGTVLSLVCNKEQVLVTAQGLSCHLQRWVCPARRHLCSKVGSLGHSEWGGVRKVGLVASMSGFFFFNAYTFL